MRRNGRAVEPVPQQPSLRELREEHLRAARFLIARERWDAARDALLRILEKFGEDPEILMELGTIYTKLGDYSAAFQYYRRAEELGAPQEISLDVARALFKAGSAEEAVTYLKRKLQEITDPCVRLAILDELTFIMPDDVELLSAKAAALEQMGSFSLAAVAYVDLSERLLVTGSSEEARKACERAISLDPENRDAVRLLRVLDESSSSPVAALVEEAERLRAGGDVQGAIDAYLSAIRTGASSPDIHYALGVTLMAADRWLEAASHLQKASHEPGLFVPVQFGLGQCYENMGDLTTAAGRYVAALEGVDFNALEESDLPDLWEIVSATARVLHRLGRSKEAIAILRQFQRFASSHPTGPIYGSRAEDFIEQIVGLTELWPVTESREWLSGPMSSARGRQLLAEDAYSALDTHGAAARQVQTHQGEPLSPLAEHLHTQEPSTGLPVKLRHSQSDPARLDSVGYQMTAEEARDFQTETVASKTSEPGTDVGEAGGGSRSFGDRAESAVEAMALEEPYSAAGDQAISSEGSYGHGSAALDDPLKDDRTLSRREQDSGSDMEIALQAAHNDLLDMADGPGMELVPLDGHDRSPAHTARSPIEGSVSREIQGSPLEDGIFGAETVVPQGEGGVNLASIPDGTAILGSASVLEGTPGESTSAPVVSAANAYDGGDEALPGREETQCIQASTESSDQPPVPLAELGNKAEEAPTDSMGQAFTAGEPYVKLGTSEPDQREGFGRTVSSAHPEAEAQLASSLASLSGSSFVLSNEPPDEVVTGDRWETASIGDNTSTGERRAAEDKEDVPLGTSNSYEVPSGNTLEGEYTFAGKAHPDVKAQQSDTVLSDGEQGAPMNSQFDSRGSGNVDDGIGASLANVAVPSNGPLETGAPCFPGNTEDYWSWMKPWSLIDLAHELPATQCLDRAVLTALGWASLGRLSSFGQAWNLLKSFWQGTGDPRPLVKVLARVVIMPEPVVLDKDETVDLLRATLKVFGMSGDLAVAAVGVASLGMDVTPVLEAVESPSPLYDWMQAGVGLASSVPEGVVASGLVKAESSDLRLLEAALASGNFPAELNQHVVDSCILLLWAARHARGMGWLGLLLRRLGDKEKAKQVFVLADRIAQGSVELWRTLAGASPVEALPVELLEQHKADLPLWILSPDEESGKMVASQAEQLASLLAVASRQSARLNQLLAPVRRAVEQNDWATAVDQLAGLAQRFPKVAVFHKMRALSLIRAGRYDEAIKVLVDLGEAFKAERPEEARRDLLLAAALAGSLGQRARQMLLKESADKIVS